MTNKKYVRNFTESEKQLFNTKIEKDKIRYSTMSVYSYLIKQFENTDKLVLEISYRDFLKKYKHHHEKISLGTLANRFEKLIELGLLSVVKKGQKNFYKLNSFLNSFLNSSNLPESTDITNINEVDEIPKAKSLIRDIYNIYISASEADAIANEVIKDLGIKRKIVKKAIAMRVKQVSSTINPAGAVAYITKIAIETITYFEIAAQRVNKLITIKKNKENRNASKQVKGNFNNYKQREYTQEQYQEILDVSACDWTTELI